MKVAFLKKHIFRICLIFILAMSVFLSIYTTMNYSTNTTQTQNKFEQSNSFNRDGNQLPNNTGQMPREQNPSQHMAPPGGNMQAPNGNMPAPNMNMQKGGTSTTTKYAP